MRLGGDVSKQLMVRVTADTLLEEARLDKQKFKRWERVRLRGFPDVGKGTVMRAAVQDEGGVRIEWGNGREGLHNPRSLENVWLDEQGEEED